MKGRRIGRPKPTCLIIATAPQSSTKIVAGKTTQYFKASSIRHAVDIGYAYIVAKKMRVEEASARRCSPLLENLEIGKQDQYSYPACLQRPGNAPKTCQREFL